jgi:hypothetical protein
MLRPHGTAGTSSKPSASEPRDGLLRVVYWSCPGPVLVQCWSSKRPEEDLHGTSMEPVRAGKGSARNQCGIKDQHKKQMTGAGWRRVCSTKVAAAAMVGMKQQHTEPPPLPTYPFGKMVASETMMVLTYMKKKSLSSTRATMRHSLAILPCASFSLSLVMYVRKMRLISRISLSIA